MIVVATFFVGFVVTTQAAPKQTICPLMIEEEIDEGHTAGTSVSRRMGHLGRQVDITPCDFGI